MKLRERMHHAEVGCLANDHCQRCHARTLQQVLQTCWLLVNTTACDNKYSSADLIGGMRESAYLFPPPSLQLNHVMLILIKHVWDESSRVRNRSRLFARKLLHTDEAKNRSANSIASLLELGQRDHPFVYKVRKISTSSNTHRQVDERAAGRPARLAVTTDLAWVIVPHIQHLKNNKVVHV